MRYFPPIILLLLAVVLSGSSTSDRASEVVFRPGQDHALFFAVDDYLAHAEFLNLSNPISSAKAIAAELRDMYAFQTEVVENPTKDRIYEVLQRYREKRFGPNDQLFVFFSGHGDFDEFEVKGFFIPKSGPRIDLTSLGNIIAKIPCKHTLLAIDACYSGTIDQKIAFMGRFNRPGVTQDTERQNLIDRKLRNQSRLLLTSGTKQRTPGGTNGSPFADGILQSLKAGYGSSDGLVTYEDLISRLERVSPLPFHGKLPGHDEGSFVFVANTFVPAASPSPSPVVTPTPVRPSPSPPDNMIFVKGGTFQMGDLFGDGGFDEKPVHDVALSDFYLSRTELSVEEFAEFIKATSFVTDAEKGGGSYLWTGSKFDKKTGVSWRDDTGGNARPFSEYNHPVVHISWYDAIKYCNWLSGEHDLSPVYTINGASVTPNWSAKGYRLPTEAEWEYAARSGGKLEKWAGTSSVSELMEFANLSGNGDGYLTTAPVGTLRTNSLGLADMSGNVWELCWDWYDSSYYGKSPFSNPSATVTNSGPIIRGGSWNYNSSSCRTTARDSGSSTDGISYVGFRIARNY